MSARKVFTILCRFGLVLGFLMAGAIMGQHEAWGEEIALPKPRLFSRVSLESALHQRRSHREYLGIPLSLAEVSQLLWAAQGITSKYGYRTAPSAGALYPLELYLVAGHVTDLFAGVYKYRPHKHALESIAKGDFRSELASAALGQSQVRDGAIVLIFAAVYERTTVKYGRRGIQYVHMEVGHVAQNVYLQAVALELGTVFIGAFSGDSVKTVLKMPDQERPLGIMPVGRPK